MRLTRLFAAAFVLVPSVASAQVVYSNNFETDVHGLTGLTNSSLISYPSGCSSTIVNCPGHYLGNSDGIPFRLNQSFELNLTGLEAHTGLNVSFDLLALLSLDGNGPNGGGPDPLIVQVDHVTQFSYTFANYTGGNTQSYCPLAANPCAPRTGANENDTLGYGSGDDFGNSLYALSINVAHTGSTATITFFSATNQDWSDEGMGFDNLEVSLTGATTAPEPASLALLATGFVGLGGVARRKRSAR